MRTQHLSKNKNHYVVFLFFISSLLMSCDYLPGGGGGDHHDLIVKKEILAIQEEFIKSETNKDADAHRLLFISEASPVDFAFKNYGEPYIANLNREIWIQVFTGWDYEYYPEYFETEFFIEKGMAIDSHQFQGYKNEVSDLHGNDLFMYIETEAGWKLLGLTSTIINPDDITDYSTLDLVSANPNEVLTKFKTGFNEANSSVFETAFTSATTPCLRFNNKFKGAYSESSHTAATFFSDLTEVSDAIKIDFNNVSIEIKDQLTAVVSASYEINGEEFNEKGKMLAMLAATPDLGWKITAMAFSIDAE